MPTTQTDRPAFRKPWTHGAKAYEEADSLPALREGLKRARKSRLVKVARDAVADLPCAVCGIPLGDPYAANKGGPTDHVDKAAFLSGDYDPRSGTFVPLHYYCSWGVLMDAVVRLHRHGVRA